MNENQIKEIVLSWVLLKLDNVIISFEFKL